VYLVPINAIRGISVGEASSFHIVRSRAEREVASLTVMEVTGVN
jgi:hypothetical protein